MTPDLNSQQIQQLNDAFRTTFNGGTLVLTSGIQALEQEDQVGILYAVRKFNTFTPDNDPHQEHDFGSLTYKGHRIFWKMDYYDLDLKFHSENAAEPNVTQRVLTIMLASEY